MTIGFITGYKSKLGFTPSKNATLVPKVPRHRTVFSLLSNSKIVVIQEALSSFLFLALSAVVQISQYPWILVVPLCRRVQTSFC